MPRQSKKNSNGGLLCIPIGTMVAESATHPIDFVKTGFWATVCCNPSDVIKSRMMASHDHASSTMTSVLRDTIRNDGWITLYKGFFQNWASSIDFLGYI